MRRGVASAVCLALALGGCGGDDEDNAADTQTTTRPEVTAPLDTLPRSTPAPAPAPQGTMPAPAPPSGPPGSGGTTAPPPEPEPASPQNDRPPPPGSPAERFERECEANPDECG